MTIIEKRRIINDFCNTTDCDNCPLTKEKWSISIRGDCLNISVSPEEDLDRALEIIENYKKSKREVTEENDVVNRPSHYTDGKIEVIDFIEDKNLGFCLGNAVKYIARAGKKDPTKEVEDLKKAEWYIKRRIKELEEASGE